MAKTRGFISPYRTYVFKDKDPIIDFARTAVENSNMSLKQVHENSNVSQTTLWNWFHGNTRRPQFATVAAVLLACGRTDVNLTALAKRNRH